MGTNLMAKSVFNDSILWPEFFQTDLLVSEFIKYFNRFFFLIRKSRYE